MHWIFYVVPVLTWLIFIPSSIVYAQNTICPDSLQEANGVGCLEGELAQIEIEAARLSSLTSENAPFSFSLLNRPPERRNFEPGLSLDEVLRELPGLLVNNRGNAALGERIIVRGMGWRSQFGVRGVQVLLDGIPLTMPDGQAFADIVSPAMIQRAELIRGPASLFWGNGSGGVLFLSTRKAASSSNMRLRALSGGEEPLNDADAVQHISFEGQTGSGARRFSLFVSNDQRGGYRDYSSFRFTRAAFYGTIPLRSSSVFQFTGALADQDAENPGQLTAEQFAEDPDMANARNVETMAGKESFQAQLGGTLLSETALGQLSVTSYGIIRDLDNPLSFTYIDLNRLAGGVRATLQNQVSNFEWGLGFDAAVQEDDRRNVNNVQGSPGSEVSLAQDESVRSFSTFGFIRAQIAGALSATAGIRGDFIRFSMDDRFLTNGDQSGNRNFSAISPAIGLSYEMRELILYTNYRNSFETPTTTELVNRPDLDGGFNPDVDPQRVNAFEFGVRGEADLWNIDYDVALYSMQIIDRLNPFQTEQGGDRTFFRNEGENNHRGIELSVYASPTEWLNGQIIHTSNRFVYKEDELEGNRLPGIPDHRTKIFVRLDTGNLWVQGSYQNISSYYVNDENTEKTDAYSVVDLNVGFTGLDVNGVALLPFFKVGNLFDETYSGSVLINAFGGRYYEPAPGRTYQAGINVLL